MRIIAGKFKGATLHLPYNKSTRPLKDRARESIFNLLIHSKKIAFDLEKSNILDLFSGTGSFGLECLSRKAKSVCFVEKEKDAIEILKKNIEKLKLEKKASIFFDDVFNLIRKQNVFESKFNLIFCDPPFKNIDIEKLMELIFNNRLLHNDGIIILHRKKNVKDKLKSYYKILDERVYGISKVTFGKFLS